MANTESKSTKVDTRDEYVIEGNVYVNKNTKVEVTPYFVDLANALVQYNTLGRGDEKRMKTAEFLDTFEDAGPISPTLGEKTKK